VARTKPVLLLDSLPQPQTTATLDSVVWVRKRLVELNLIRRGCGEGGGRREKERDILIEYMKEKANEDEIRTKGTEMNPP
jgi:hypothetical protein